MPRRHDLESIFLIGSGPIVIGQACEFDYAGSQALKVLREEGYRTIVVNSNPATIMTDPGFAVEPSEEREANYVSLYDSTVEGLAYPELRARSVRFHPEAGPGPHDARALVDDWVEEVRAAAA